MEQQEQRLQEFEWEQTHGKHSPEGLEAGAGGAALEQVAMKIIQNITLTFGDKEMSAEQLMAAAKRLREQAAAIQNENSSHDAHA
jgi:hypothetical protein